jgi:glutathione S-transferase
MTAYTIYGALGSPYSLKVRAALRAKQLPVNWVGINPYTRGEVDKHVKVPVIPIIECPDGSWTNDSTPFLLDLEAKNIGRPLLPEDPLQRFACLLIEDMADEWLTKAMFHYRWFYDADEDQMSHWLIFDSHPGANISKIDGLAATFAHRQKSRMAMVGCTPDTAPIIEKSADRLMDILNRAALGGTRFLFGDLPSLADVSLYGQLWQMRTDPTPAAHMRGQFPYLFRWLEHVDDASGARDGWGNQLSDSVCEILSLAGDTYLPFLQANKEALASGADRFSVDIDGKEFSQDTFKYQVKCLTQLQQFWNELTQNDRDILSKHIGSTAKLLDA